MGRVVIDKGFLIKSVDVGNILGDLDVNAVYYLAFQLYEENGQPAKGSYTGAGFITEEDGNRHVVLGDLMRSTQLSSYKISPTPDPESEKNLDDFVSGVKAGRAGKRMKKNASAIYRDGFDEGKKQTR